MAALVVAAVGFVLAPGIPPLCPARLLFHIPCPSCGLTRAASCVLRLDFVGATHFHPLWWLVFPYIAGIGALEGAGYVRTGAVGSALDQPLVRQAGALLAGALVLLWIARACGAMGGPVSID